MKKTDIILALHFFTGLLLASFPTVVFYWIIGVYVISLAVILFAKSDPRTYLFAAYLIGLEILGRMTGAGLPHEFVKYAVSSLFLLDLAKFNRFIPVHFFIYGLLLIPGILMADLDSFETTRQHVSANLSGPLCLMVSAIYFYNRPIDLTSFKSCSLNLIYPVATVLAFLFIETPRVSDIAFGYGSNFATSVYGPNQVSAILGLVIMLVGISFLLKVPLFSFLVAVTLVVLLSYRGLLTFSRGGIIGPVLILILLFLYVGWKTLLFGKGFWRIFWVMFVSSLLGAITFIYTNTQTKNALLNRYVGVSHERAVGIDKLSSGRSVIMYSDWMIFNENVLFGVGAGMSQFERVRYGLGDDIAPHNEFTRLLAEHGLLGMIAGLLLIGSAVVRFFEYSTVRGRVLLVAFVGFGFLFMLHSATRIAAPCFLYGLGFALFLPHYKTRYSRRTFALA